MTKFDTKESLPNCFLEHNLNLLAIRNGQYAIFKDPGYTSFLEFEEGKMIAIQPQKVQVGDITPLDTLPFSAQMNESSALDFAHYIGLFDKYFSQTKTPGGYFLTTRGRFYSKPFSITTPTTQLDVQSVQVEVDAGFENESEVLLIEAKTGLRGNTNLRQILYPYLHFKAVTKKRIRVLIQLFSDGVYYFLPVNINGSAFSDCTLGMPIAIQVVDESAPSSVSTKRELLERINSIQPHGTSITYPQADNFQIILDIISNAIVDEEFLLRSQNIAEGLGYDKRQGNYYLSAAHYLDLIVPENASDYSGKHYELTEDAKAIFNLNAKLERDIQLVLLMAKRASFRAGLITMIVEERELEREELLALMRSEKSDINKTTLGRRVSTLRHWLGWAKTRVLDELD